MCSAPAEAPAADASTLSKRPVRDRAEMRAYFPSPYSLAAFTAPQTGAAQPHYANPYKGRKKVLMINTQERYLPVHEGKYFSSGNHPVETLLPLAHIVAAGFEVDVATPSGDHVKFENWAYPDKDPVIAATYERFRDRLESPLDLREVVKQGGLSRVAAAKDGTQPAKATEDEYIAVFVPGGHGVLNDIPLSRHVGVLLNQALATDKFIITLCHGPACLLSASVALMSASLPELEHALNFVDPESLADPAPNPFAGYETCAFPDAIDRELPDIGYIPAPMRWYVGEALTQAGLKVLPSPKLGRVHRDRHLVTGDSPLAADALGKLAATTLLEAYGDKQG
ncbi:DJ-1/PfpI family protein [Oecophyllibacter saccharovorans]|uniref:Protein deglycase HchA n=1 Tax=Oecophyllibacter saccharovorans TaxID=2558360 RepID=A0A506UKX1_9PROT|nr:DJ-1/PfpI family protein [Oecophyllibacter saccharovorans]TPW33882.1 protein deglycase HchA [Oecophyllibacter saccharovorans]